MLPDFTDRTWLWVAAALYLIGFAQGTVALLRSDRPSGTVTYVLIAIGYVLQFIGLGIRGKAIHGSPLSNTFEVFQFTAWSAITLYLVVGVRFRNSLLGYFTSCLTAALTVVSLSIPEWDATRRPHVLGGGNPWIELHATLALFSYGVFALLALTSLMFLLRNYSLKSKRIGGLFSFLPSILDLDHISVRLLVAGVTILSISVGVILAYYLRDLSTANVAKVVVTVGVWLAYVVALVFRLRGRLLAKRFAWTCVGLFIAALLSLGLVDASRHPIGPKSTGAATHQGGADA
jgi:HemX protein